MTAVLSSILSVGLPLYFIKFPPQAGQVTAKFAKTHSLRVSTSYVERQNLTMRMQMRRFTRLTNALSKKVEHLEAAVALHFMWYNFGRIHQTLRITPAMAAGVTDHVWRLDEVIGLLEAAEEKTAAN